MPTLIVQGQRAFCASGQPQHKAYPAVVFVHGAGGSHQHWLFQVRDLAGASSYTLDLPGHGRSEGPGRDSIAAYGDWLISFLDAAGLDQAVLVGHSMGGAISMDVGLRYPERVAGLGLVATGARLRVAPAILDGILANPKKAVRLICDWAYGPEAPPEMVRLGRRQMSAVAPDVLHGDFVACDAFDVLDRLGELAIPTLVVTGTQDRLTPIKYATSLRDGIPGAALTLVEGAGHMVMVENPGVVAGALAGLLETL